VDDERIFVLHVVVVFVDVCGVQAGQPTTTTEPETRLRRSNALGFDE